MEEMISVKKSFDLFGLQISEPWGTLIHLALLIVIGMMLITLIIVALRRLLKRSSALDEMLNSFIISAVRVICIIGQCGRRPDDHHYTAV